MVLHYANIFYIPFLLLSIIATVIASQAMISGMFSIVYQGINTRVMPMFKVDYTSAGKEVTDIHRLRQLVFALLLCFS